MRRVATMIAMVGLAGCYQSGPVYGDAREDSREVIDEPVADDSYDDWALHDSVPDPVETFPDTAPDSGPSCGNGVVEAWEECEGAGDHACTTSCGTAGTRACSSCRWEGACEPPEETCNGIDDDCDWRIDEAAGSCVVFEGDFESGVLGSEWVSIHCCQSVVDGRLRLEDMDGWPRDSQAVVHDGDPEWTDYQIELLASNWGSPYQFTILLRTDGFTRSSGGCSGTCYQLGFYGTAWTDGWPNHIALRRTDCRLPTGSPGREIILADVPWHPASDGPFDIRVALEGGRIRLMLDGEPEFDVVDPDPFPYGGVGVHAIWETVAFFDDIVVTPLPGDCGSICETPPECDPGAWDLACDFSVSSNPTGAWSYGNTGVLGEFALFPVSSPTNCWSTVPCTADASYHGSLWKNETPSTAYGVEPGQVSLHPGCFGDPWLCGTEWTVVRWTSPFSGEAIIRGFFGSGDAGTPDLDIASVSAGVPSVLWHRENTAGTETFDLATPVHVGDSIDFVVGDAYYYGNTPLEVAITQAGGGG